MPAAETSTSARTSEQGQQADHDQRGRCAEGGVDLRELGHRPDQRSQSRRQTQTRDLGREREPAACQRQDQPGDDQRQPGGRQHDARQGGDDEDETDRAGAGGQEGRLLVAAAQGECQQSRGDECEATEHDPERDGVEAEGREPCGAEGRRRRPGGAARPGQDDEPGERQGGRAGEQQERVEGLVDRNETNRGGLGQRCPHRDEVAGGVREQRERRRQHPGGAGGQRHPRHGVPRGRGDGGDQRPHQGHGDRDGGQLVRRAVEAGEHGRERDDTGDQRRAPLARERVGPGDGPEEQ